MNLVALENVLENEPKYRLKQAKAAVFKDLIEKWQEAKTLPQDLRKKLGEGCPLQINAKVFSSQKQGAEKAVFVFLFYMMA